MCMSVSRTDHSYFHFPIEDWSPGIFTSRALLELLVTPFYSNRIDVDDDDDDGCLIVCRCSDSDSDLKLHDRH